MYTVFINTSKKLDISRHKYLLDEFKKEKQLMVDTYALEELNDCAEKISRTITRDNDIGEEFNLIVYVEAKGRNEEALAYERAAELFIHENLITALYQRGRRAQKVLILFGENFTRNKEYGTGTSFQNTMINNIWNNFPLPEPAKAAEIIMKVRNSFGTVGNGSLKEYCEQVWRELTADEHPNCLLKRECSVVRDTVYVLADNFKKTDKISEDALKTNLFTAINGLVNSWKTDLTETAETLFANLRLTDSDLNTTVRTEIHLLLFVYRCACCDNIPIVVPTDRGNDGYSIGDAVTDPVRWTKLSSVLKDKKAELEKTRQEIDSMSDHEFPKFNDELISKERIVPLVNDPPELTVDMKVKHSMTVKGLRNAVDQTISDVETKDRENADTVTEYITAETEAFNDRKDVRFKKVKYKQENVFTGVPANELKNIEKKCDNALAEFSSHERFSNESENIDGLITQTSVRTSYLFECFKGKVILFVMLGIFLFAVAVPYIAVRTTVFDSGKGAVFFLVTAAAAAAVYALSFRLFMRKFKKRIIKELKTLCDKFRQIQEKRQACLNDYVKLISKDIPLCFLLRLYMNEYKQHLKDNEMRGVYKNYHIKHLNKYIAYIDHLIDDLDIRRSTVGEGEAPERLAALDLEEDVYGNNNVYTVVNRRDIDDLFFTEGQNNDNRNGGREE